MQCVHGFCEYHQFMNELLVKLRGFLTMTKDLCNLRPNADSISDSGIIVLSNNDLILRSEGGGGHNCKGKLSDPKTTSD